MRTHAGGCEGTCACLQSREQHTYTLATLLPGAEPMPQGRSWKGGHRSTAPSTGASGQGPDIAHLPERGPCLQMDRKPWALSGGAHSEGHQEGCQHPQPPAAPPERRCLWLSGNPARRTPQTFPKEGQPFHQQKPFPTQPNPLPWAPVSDASQRCGLLASLCSSGTLILDPGLEAD